MEIQSISRVYDLYMGKIRERVFTTLKDQNNKQIVEQVVLYSKLPVQQPVKGAHVDITV